MLSFILGTCLIILAQILTLQLLRRRRHKSLNLKTEKIRLMCVLGSGGHTSELLRLVGSLGPAYGATSYVAADSDSTSAPRVAAVEETRGQGFSIHRIPRSREVGQSYVSSVATTLYSCAAAFVVVLRARPSVVVVNGPGTCVPVVAAAFLLDLLLFRTCFIVFVESLCRVKSLSLTGRILYRTGMADKIVVQWPEQAELFPGTMFIARF